MKKGDVLPVKVEGITVAQAEVEAVETDRVTLLIPGTRVVVAIKVSLSDERQEAEKEVIIDGVDRPAVPEAAEPVVIEAPVTTEGTVEAAAPAANTEEVAAE